MALNSFKCNSLTSMHFNPFSPVWRIYPDQCTYTSWHRWF